MLSYTLILHSHIVQHLKHCTDVNVPSFTTYLLFHAKYVPYPYLRFCAPLIFLPRISDRSILRTRLDDAILCTRLMFIACHWCNLLLSSSSLAAFHPCLSSALYCPNAHEYGLFAPLAVTELTASTTAR